MYQFLLACHIISFTSWMAGLFYLPRLFVYHADETPLSKTAKTFEIMEYRLLKIIMNPAMLLTWIFGILLFFTNDYGFASWLIIKFIFVLVLTFFHIYLGKCRKRFIKHENKQNSRFFRKINEIPTVILIIIVFLAIFKP